MKTIKKYANRKLYDADKSKYITVASLLTLPVGSFRVIENETHEDITDETLFSALSSYFSSNPEAFKADRDSLVAKVAAGLASV